MRASEPEASGILDRDGVSISYEVHGHGGTTVVMIPPSPITHSRIFKAQIPYLARHYRVVTLDGRGNGGSGRPIAPAAHSRAENTADILAVFDATDTARAILMAHGISAALRDAELCARAIDRALRNPDEEADAMGQFERTCDTLSRQLFRESQALARYEWDAEEASERMRTVSAAVTVECDTLAALPGSAAPAVHRAPEVGAVNGKHTNSRAPSGELQQIGSAEAAPTAR